MLPSSNPCRVFALLIFLLISAPLAFAGNIMTTSHDRAILGSLAHDAKYDKDFPEMLHWPQDISKARIVFDRQNIEIEDPAMRSLLAVSQKDSQNQKPPFDETYVREALTTFFVRNGDDWRHGYSHVPSDVVGHLEFPDKNQMRWLIRPGGLALVLYPDGGIVYLAREINPNWKTVARSELAKVAVERRLYRKEGSDRLFAHVFIYNLINHPIGFDVKTRMNLFYPNQWCESNEPTRQLIDEMRPKQSPLSEKTKEDLLAEMKNPGKTTTLILVKPKDYYEYFIALNSGKPKLLEHSKFSNLILVMDGNMAVTDGKSVETLNRSPHDMNKAEVPIPSPITPSVMASGAPVFE
jgi:hypothetical protein